MGVMRVIKLNQCRNEKDPLADILDELFSDLLDSDPKQKGGGGGITTPAKE